MKTLLCCFFISITVIALSQSECKYSVLYGESDIHLDFTDSNVIRIFLDKDGFYYPSRHIDDEQLSRNRVCNSLRTWYEQDSTNLKKICADYNVTYSQNFSLVINTLNNAIARQNVEQINKAALKYGSITFLIHGYRKKAWGSTDKLNSLSSVDFDATKKVMQNLNTLFVEVYWDSRYINPKNIFHGIKTPLRLFQNFVIPDSKEVGLSLRKIISNVSACKINIITHSIGALIASEALFNVTDGQLEEEIFLNTSSANIILCMVAPAIGPETIQNYYYKRNTPYSYTQLDNYKLILVYNKSDIALLKNPGRLAHLFTRDANPLTYGNTSLGCNYNGSVDSVQTFFNEHKNSFLFGPVNVTDEVKGNHYMSSYVESNSFKAYVIPNFY